MATGRGIKSFFKLHLNSDPNSKLFHLTKQNLSPPDPCYPPTLYTPLYLSFPFYLTANSPRSNPKCTLIASHRLYSYLLFPNHSFISKNDHTSHLKCSTILKCYSNKKLNFYSLSTKNYPRYIHFLLTGLQESGILLTLNLSTS